MVMGSQNPSPSKVLSAKDANASLATSAIQADKTVKAAEPSSPVKGLKSLPRDQKQELASLAENK